MQNRKEYSFIPMKWIGLFFKTFLVLFLAFIVSFSISCSTKRVGTGEPPDVLYAKAEKELAKKRGFANLLNGINYEKVFNLLKEIRVRHPYSPYTPLAELKTADAYFKQGEYAQAVVEYEEFIKRRPLHENAPYAAYRLGRSYYQMRKGVDRDPTSIMEANKWFAYFIANYPESPYIDKASRYYTKTRRNLANREIYVAKFYVDKHDFKAAAGRYKTIVDRFPDSDKLEEALYKLGESYYKMGEFAMATEPLRRILVEYPEDEYHVKATELLEKAERKLLSSSFE